MVYFDVFVEFIDEEGIGSDFVFEFCVEMIVFCEDFDVFDLMVDGVVELVDDVILWFDVVEEIIVVVDDCFDCVVI